MHRGEIWWATMAAPGSAAQLRLPVLIVQDDVFNESLIQTVVVAAISMNEHLAEAPGTVQVPPEVTGFAQPAIANLSQLFTLSKVSLTERIGAIPEDLRTAINSELQLVLSL
ncbi:MAG: type II toxin-antitoxin system PemK/MazF family toxin [Leptolyngbya sp. SIO4C1]|nr:type II toxin-antitoxin system PemK/MazF family toxin [Leptolyngbya sp. SIO4C1]